MQGCKGGFTCNWAWHHKVAKQPAHTLAKQLPTSREISLALSGFNGLKRQTAQYPAHENKAMLNYLATLLLMSLLH